MNLKTLIRSLPLKGSNEFIKPRRSSRSSISKPPITPSVKSAKRVSFKAGKGSNSLKEIEEDVSDRYEHKDEEFDRDLESNAFSDSQSIDSRSCGESISDLQAEVEKELVREIVNETFKVNNLSNVTSVGNVIDGGNLGPIPVLISENPILNSNRNNGDSPRTSPNGSPRILRRGETLTDGGSRSNAKFSFNESEKWPSLNENRNVNNMDISREKLDEVRHVNEDSVMQEGDSVKKSVSFVKAVQGIKGSGNNKLRRIPVSIDESGKERVDMDPLIEEGSKSWGMTLVGYFVGLRMSYREIIGHLRRMWRAYHLRPWLVDGKSLFIQKWEAGMCMQKPEPSKVPLMTTSMCEKSYGRASFARVLIEVEAESGLVDEIEVYYNSLGKFMKLRVEYPWKPPVCAHCKVFGYGYNKCNSRPMSDAEKSHGTEVRGQRREADMGYDNGMNDWQTVNYRRGNKSENVHGGFIGQRYNYGEGTSRGGFSGRGRGGFGGRGFGDHRFNRGESSKYVPVKKNGNEAVKDGMVSDQSNKGKNKQDVDMNTNEVNNRNGVNKGSMDSGKKDSRKKNIKKHNTTDNRFAELIDESEIENNLECESMRQRIDLACEKGVHISIEEKNSWDEELRNYFMMKMQESVMVERGLTENQAYPKIYDEVYKDELDRINVLDIRKQCAEVELFFKTGQVFTIYELETWTDEKLEFYKASIGEEAYMKIFKKIKSDSNESMDDEVVKDLSENAQFMAKNVVTNGIDTDLN
ncbi:hypothetical protein Tco_1325399 [Tanacetum coccineum]